VYKRQMVNSLINKQYQYAFIIDQDRADFMGLLIPLINRITSVNMAVLVLTTNKIYNQYLQKMRTQNLSFIFIDDGLVKGSSINYLVIIKNIIGSLIKTKKIRQISVSAYRNYCIQAIKYSYYNSVYSQIKNIEILNVVYIHLLFNPALKKNINGYKIALQHGTLGITDFNIFEGADEVILWGEKWRENLQNSYSGKMIPLGNPKFDNIYNHSNNYNGNLSKILIISQTHGLSDIEKKIYFNYIKEFSIMQSGCSITIKLHPAESQSVYSDSGITCGNSLKIVKDGDLYKLIRDNDIVIGVNSTVLLESVVIGKLVFCLPFSTIKIGWENNGIREIHTPSELCEEFKKLKNPDYQLKMYAEQQGIIIDYCSNIGIATNTIFKYLLSKIQ